MYRKTIKAALLLLLFNGLLAIPMSGQIPPWHAKLKELVPWVTSQSEIERIFPEAQLRKEYTYSSEGMHEIVYDTEYGTLSVIFTLGECPNARGQYCHVNGGKVVEASLQLKRPIEFSKLKLKKKGLDYFVENDNPTEHYVDLKIGIDDPTSRCYVPDKIISSHVQYCLALESVIEVTSLD